MFFTILVFFAVCSEEPCAFVEPEREESTIADPLPIRPPIPFQSLALVGDKFCSVIDLTDFPLYFNLIGAR